MHTTHLHIGVFSNAITYSYVILTGSLCIAKTLTYLQFYEYHFVVTMVTNNIRQHGSAVYVGMVVVL